MDRDVDLQFNNLASNSPYLGAYVLELAQWVRERPQLYKRLADRLDLLVNYVSEDAAGHAKSRIANGIIYVNLLITRKEMGHRSRKTRDFAPARIQQAVGYRLIAELIRRNQALDTDGKREPLEETYRAALQAFHDSFEPTRSNWYFQRPSQSRTHQ